MDLAYYIQSRILCCYDFLRGDHTPIVAKSLKFQFGMLFVCIVMYGLSWQPQQQVVCFFTGGIHMSSLHVSVSKSLQVISAVHCTSYIARKFLS